MTEIAYRSLQKQYVAKVSITGVRSMQTTYGQKYSQGFTLIEIMVAVTVFALLAAIAFPAYNGYVERARSAKAISDLQLIATRIESFRVMNGDAPPASLAVIDREWVDPWGEPYQYLLRSAAAEGQARKNHEMVAVNTDYDLYSMGPDGKSESPFTSSLSRDDIARANDGAFIGLVKNHGTRKKL